MSQLGLLARAATRKLPSSGFRIDVGDCRQVLAELPPEEVDAVVTDPPYELGFMGKSWDSSGVAFQVRTWREVLRVMKPGAHLLAFSGRRTYHRMVVAIEDAGFEIRDQWDWWYGSGFPKSTNLGGGWGTAARPAHEPICVARRPVEGTAESTFARLGTGGLNIDAGRLPLNGVRDFRQPDPDSVKYSGWGTLGGSKAVEPTDLGRWPPSVLVDQEVAAQLDAAVGIRKSGANPARRNSSKFSGQVFAEYEGQKDCTPARGADEGGPSRFFYVAKPSRKERDLGLKEAGFELRSGGEATDREDGSAGTRSPSAGAGRNGGVYNDHPTVKPVALMRQLVRLVTPTGGLVLDPFSGSGTTGVAAALEGFRYFGVDLSEHYQRMGEARIRAHMVHAGAHTDAGVASP